LKFRVGLSHIVRNRPNYKRAKVLTRFMINMFILNPLKRQSLGHRMYRQRLISGKGSEVGNEIDFLRGEGDEGRGGSH